VLTGDKETGLTPLFNAAKVKDEVQAQVAITAEFGKSMSKVVGDYAKSRRDELRAELDAETDPDKKAQLKAQLAKWEEGGSYLVSSHILVGGLTGGLPGAIGAGTSQTLIDEAGKLISDSDLPTELKQALVMGAGTFIGAATGGTAGASTGFNATTNNYLSHLERKTLKQAESDCYTKRDQSACATASDLKKKDELSDKLLTNAVATCKGPECNEVTNFIREEMAKQGCTAPSACPDYNKLSNYWNVAQAKAQGLEPVYPEAWLLDGKAVLDLGKWGIKAVSGSGKGSLDALSQLNKTDTAKVNVNARVDDFEQYDQFRKADSTRPGGEWDWDKHAPNGGAVPGTQQVITLQPGTKVDRYGPPSGTYLSPEGIPYDARALPPGAKADGYTQYTVNKPFTVEKAEVAPAFNQPGGGVQYRVVTPSGLTLRVDINYLIKNEYLLK
jgi:hypothetical protein